MIATVQERLKIELQTSNVQPVRSIQCQGLLFLCLYLRGLGFPGLSSWLARLWRSPLLYMASGLSESAI